MPELLHPNLPEIFVPRTVTFRFEEEVREVPLQRKGEDSPAYYSLEDPDLFEAAHRGYASFPLEVMSSEAADQLGSHSLELFVFHPGSSMEVQQIVRPEAVFSDTHYMGSGVAIKHALGSNAVEVTNVGSGPDHQLEFRYKQLLTYYATTVRGLGFVSLTQPAYMLDMEQLVQPGDPDASSKFWTIHAELRARCNQITPA